MIQIGDKYQTKFSVYGRLMVFEVYEISSSKRARHPVHLKCVGAPEYRLRLSEAKLANGYTKLESNKEG